MRWGNEGISWGKEREHFGSESLEVRSIFVNFESERRKLASRFWWWMDGWSFGGVQSSLVGVQMMMEFVAGVCGSGMQQSQRMRQLQTDFGAKSVESVNCFGVWIVCEYFPNISHWHSERNDAASQAKQPDTGKFRAQKPRETFHTEICVKDRINKKVEHSKVFVIFTIFFARRRMKCLADNYTHSFVSLLLYWVMGVVKSVFFANGLRLDGALW